MEFKQIEPRLFYTSACKKHIILRPQEKTKKFIFNIIGTIFVFQFRMHRKIGVQETPFFLIP